MEERSKLDLLDRFYPFRYPFSSTFTSKSDFKQVSKMAPLIFSRNKLLANPVTVHKILRLFRESS